MMHRHHCIEEEGRRCCKSLIAIIRPSIETGERLKLEPCLTYLEHLGEEARADFLAEEVVNARQAGHGAPQRPVRGRPHAVGGVDAVHGQLVRPAVTLLGVAKIALRVVVHGAPHGPDVWFRCPQEEAFTSVSWRTR